MILGLVRWLQPVHGYDVRRELLSWSVNEWANIAPGSIYHALRKLTEEGLLEEVATEQVGARPARTTYRVTDQGDAEFEVLLGSYWWEYRHPIDPFLVAVSFLPALPRSEALAALQNRIRLLEEQIAGVHAAAEAIPDVDPTRPPHVGWMLDLYVDRWTAEIAWCRRVIDRVGAGLGLHLGEYDVADAGQRWREAIAQQAAAAELGSPVPEDNR